MQAPSIINSIFFLNISNYEKIIVFLILKVTQKIIIILNISKKHLIKYPW